MPHRADHARHQDSTQVLTIMQATQDQSQSETLAPIHNSVPFRRLQAIRLEQTLTAQQMLATSGTVSKGNHLSC